MTLVNTPSKYESIELPNCMSSTRHLCIEEDDIIIVIIIGQMSSDPPLVYLLIWIWMHAAHIVYIQINWTSDTCPLVYRVDRELQLLHIKVYAHMNNIHSCFTVCVSSSRWREAYFILKCVRRYLAVQRKIKWGKGMYVASANRVPCNLGLS